MAAMLHFQQTIMLQMHNMHAEAADNKARTLRLEMERENLHDVLLVA